MAGKIKITLTRSPIGRPDKHRKVIDGLGLTRPNKSVVRDDTKEIRGMIFKVSHMLSVEEA